MNKSIFFNFILFVWVNFLNAQSNYEYDGQILGQTNIGFGKESTKFLGTRYLPEFSFNKKIDSLSSFAIETSVNLSLSKTYIPGHSSDTNSNLSPYRIWLRYLKKNWELRLGLQKIDFGSAQLLRPIQWFNQIDPRDPLGLTNGVYGLLIRHYFKNNSNLWLWGLYGNEKQRGLDALTTLNDSPEFGGRFQTFIPKGEAALSYHYRKAGANNIPFFENYSSPEHRIGFDSKIDIGFGMWSELTYVHRTKNIGILTNQLLLNFGVDYTFRIGNGLTVSKEYLFSDSTDSVTNESLRRGFSALSFNYPLGLSSSLSGLIYQQWNNNTQTLMLNYQQQFNNLSGYIILYYNPKAVEGIQQNDIFQSFSGPGIQLLIVFNH